MKPRTLYIFVTLIVLSVDQITKALVLACGDAPHQLTPFLALDLVMNRGIMSGLLHFSTWLPFVIVSSIIGAFLSVFSYCAVQRARQGYAVLGEILVIAGAASNFIDRIVHGGVIDFITLHYHDYVWPVFNVADISIVLGVAFMLRHTWGDRSCGW